jgi:hypothetical protein
MFALMGICTCCTFAVVHLQPSVLVIGSSKEKIQLHEWLFSEIVWLFLLKLNGTQTKNHFD